MYKNLTHVQLLCVLKMCLIFVFLDEYENIFKAKFPELRYFTSLLPSQELRLILLSNSGTLIFYHNIMSFFINNETYALLQSFHILHT